MDWSDAAAKESKGDPKPQLVRAVYLCTTALGTAETSAAKTMHGSVQEGRIQPQSRTKKLKAAFMQGDYKNFLLTTSELG